MSGYHGSGGGYRDQRSQDRRRQQNSPPRDQRREPSPGRHNSPDSHERGRPHHNDQHGHDNRGSSRGDIRYRGSPLEDSGHRGGSRGHADERRGGGGYQGGQSGQGASNDSKQHTGYLPKEEGLQELPEKLTLSRSGGVLPKTGFIPRGTVGRQIIVRTNHFPIITMPTVKIFCYEILMRVPASSQRRGSEKVSARQQAAVILEAQSLWGNFFVYDGVNHGWSTEELCPVGEARNAMIPLKSHTPAKPNEVEVRIRNTGTLDIRRFVDYLKSPTPIGSPVSSRVKAVMDWLNATYRADPASRFIQGKPNSSAFFIRASGLCEPLRSTAGVLEAMRGIFQSATVAFGRISLNLDTATTAFYTPNKPILELACAFSGIPIHNLRRVGINQQFMQACEKILGIYFSVGHLSELGNTKKMRIRAMLTTSAKTTVFTRLMPDGSSIQTNVADYFWDKYNRKLDYPDLPLISCRDGSFPMELCHTAQGERYKEALQGAETADFITFATSPPHIRERQIYENAKRLHWHSLVIPEAMGLTVSTKMLEVKARILPAPELVYGNGGPRSGEVSTGSWNLRNLRLKEGAGFLTVGIAYLGNRYRKHDIIQLWSRMMPNFNGLGIRVPGPKDFPCFVDHGNGGRTARELYDQTGKMFNKKPEMLFFIVDDNQKAVYKELKAICEVELGVPSQVMSSTKCMNQKGLDQYIGNIGLKVNAKLGGINHVVKEPRFRDRFMIIGADCSHPSPGQLRQVPPPPSYAVFAGSMDADCSKYSAVAVAQPATTELISEARSMTKELLKRFFDKHGMYPKNILYMRDGISAGQIPALLETEVRGVQDACKETNTQIKVATINCLKRHHTRFFPSSAGPSDKNGNVVPGTCVESSATENDIFLVSQMVLKGTGRPTHYQLIQDDGINLSADDFQRIVFHGCFQYARATKSVGLHPAVRYAHIACERARMHLFTASDGSVELRDVHANLYDTMYFQ